MGYYILNDNNVPVRVDVHTWSEWFEANAPKHIQMFEDDDFYVSTVFLGLDHNFTEEGPPLIFETMIFQGDDMKDHSIYQRRYSTYDEALAGHQEALDWLKKYREEL